MENPFKEILHQEALPETLKDKIMNDISFIKLSIDVADLFAVKYPTIAGELFTMNEKKSKKNKK
jgi:hypothetical protein